METYPIGCANDNSFLCHPMNEMARNNLKPYNSSVNLTLNISGKLVLKPMTKLVHSILLVLSLGSETRATPGYKYTTWKYIYLDRVRVVQSGRLKYTITIWPMSSMSSNRVHK